MIWFPARSSLFLCVTPPPESLCIWLTFIAITQPHSPPTVELCVSVFWLAFCGSAFHETPSAFPPALFCCWGRTELRLLSRLLFRSTLQIELAVVASLVAFIFCGCIFFCGRASLCSSFLAWSPRSATRGLCFPNTWTLPFGFVDLTQFFGLAYGPSTVRTRRLC